MKGKATTQVLYSVMMYCLAGFSKTLNEFIMQAVFLLSALSFNSESSQDIQERMAIAFCKPLLKDIEKGKIVGNSICDMNHNSVTASFYTSCLRLPPCDADFTDPFSYDFILIHAHLKMNIFQCTSWSTNLFEFMR